MKKTDRKLSSKIQYIWDYYKVPLFIAALVIYIIGYIGFRYATHKDILLYIAPSGFAMPESDRCIDPVGRREIPAQTCPWIEEMPCIIIADIGEIIVYAPHLEIDPSILQIRIKSSLSEYFLFTSDKGGIIVFR